jgi:predicted dehydrogenase
MLRIDRRDFLRTSAVSVVFAGALQARLGAQPADRVRLALVGVAGRGNDNYDGVRRHADIVALCDVDYNRAASIRNTYPGAFFSADYRHVIDRKDVEAVVVSTPDHTHACVAAAALRAGKHVYCEKPLTHSVHEARMLVDLARRHRVVTQMGTQIHAGDNYHRVVEIVRSGVLGPVRTVRVWHNGRPGAGRLAGANGPTLPPNIKYDLWLGPAPYRPYHPSHLHFNWRWWWDFGGGVLADMACHFMDLPHWALELRRPTSVVAEGRVTHDGDNPVPDVLKVSYRYAARGDLPPVHLAWFHGVDGPDLNGHVRYQGYPSGVLFVGERGSLVANYGSYRMLPEDQFRGYQPPQPTLPRSIGHHREWLEAIRGRGETSCPFAYSGALTETVLLGNVAYRCGERLEWDPAAGRVTNNVASAGQYLQRDYRRGWTL